MCVVRVFALCCLGSLMFGGCKGGDAGDSPTAPGAEEAPVSKAVEKPVEAAKVVAPMPCRILQRWSDGDIAEVYTLTLDPAGKLVSSVREDVLSRGCKQLSDSCLRRPPRHKVTYSYDETGRLKEVSRALGEDRSTSLALSYAPDGRLATYEHRDPLEDGAANTTSGRVTFAEGGPATRIDTTGMFFFNGLKPTKQEITLAGGGSWSSYPDPAYVWPFDTSRPWLGTSRETASVSIEGIETKTYTRVFAPGPAGRIATVKDDPYSKEFIYNCAE